MEISNYVSANKLSDEVFQQKYEAVMALEEIAQQLQPRTLSAVYLLNTLNRAAKVQSSFVWS